MALWRLGKRSGEGSMDKDQRREEFLERVLTDKALTKQELARLPIEDKLKVTALMQRRANAIRRASGRPVRPEWSLQAVGLGEDSRAAAKAGSFAASLGDAFEGQFAELDSP